MSGFSVVIGQVIAETYRIERELGAGGMGAVYEAVHRRTGRRYAIKVLLPEMAARSDALARFRREAEAIGKLGHANVIAIHDFDEAEGLAYLVMDLLAGEDLSERLRKEPRMAVDDAVRIFSEIAGGLGAAHAAGLLHRDLKPGNVFLTSLPGAAERAVILDFGLAKSFERDEDQKLTATGIVMGTPLYMSPEQASGFALDERADLYSLATLLFEMLAGRPPFEAPSLPALFAKIATDPPPLIRRFRSDLPEALESVLARALAKSPDDRYPSAEALLAEVRRAFGRGSAAPITVHRQLTPLPVAEHPTPVGNHAQSWPKELEVVPPASLAQEPSAMPRLVLALGGSMLAIGIMAGVAVGGAAFLLAPNEESALSPRGGAIDLSGQVPLSTSAAQPEPVPPLEVATLDEASADSTDPVPVAVPLRPVESPVEAPSASERPARPTRRDLPPTATEAPVVAETPPAQEAPAPVGPPAAPAGVEATSAHMGRRDYRGCIRETQAHPPSETLLSMRATCAYFGDDPTTLNATCDELRRRYPNGAQVNTCNTLVETYARSHP